MSKFGKTLALLGTTAGVVTPVYLMQTKDENIWKNVTMPLLRKIDAEKAHRLAVKTASWGLVPKFTTEEQDQSVLKTTLVGLKFDSPVGLAAGFDKHAECYDGLLKMGFGFVEVGSITPLPQDGNEKPRVFRLPEDGAVINRYGFNSYGHQYAFDNRRGRKNGRLSPWRRDISEWYGFNSYGHQYAFDNLSKRTNHDGVVAVNLGKNKTSTDGVNDYVEGVLKFGEVGDYLVVNISSPNTPGLRKMQGRRQLEELLEKVLQARSKLKKQPPLFVKIAPDLTEDDKKDIADVIQNPKCKVDGLIVSNTTISRPNSLQNNNKQETGGLSGKPLKELSTKAIRDMYLLTKGDIPIIGVGGISSGEDAYEKICNGASLVQLYSALSLDGPPVVGKVKRELAELLRTDGFACVSDAVGCDLQEFHCPTPEDLKQVKVVTQPVVEPIVNKPSQQTPLVIQQQNTIIHPPQDISSSNNDSYIKTNHMGYILTNILAISLLHVAFKLID